MGGCGEGVAVVSTARRTKEARSSSTTGRKTGRCSRRSAAAWTSSARRGVTTLPESQKKVGKGGGMSTL